MCVTAELSVLQFWFALKNAPWGLVQGCRLIIRKRTVARSSWLWRRKGGMYNIGMAYRRPARCVDKILPKQCTHISSPPPLLCSAVHVIALRVRVRVSLSLSLSISLSNCLFVRECVRACVREKQIIQAGLRPSLVSSVCAATMVGVLPDPCTLPHRQHILLFVADCGSDWATGRAQALTGLVPAASPLLAHLSVCCAMCGSLTIISDIAAVCYIFVTTCC